MEAMRLRSRADGSWARAWRSSTCRMTGECASEAAKVPGWLGKKIATAGSGFLSPGDQVANPLPLRRAGGKSGTPAVRSQNKSENRGGRQGAGLPGLTIQLGDGITSIAGVF